MNKKFLELTDVGTRRSIFISADLIVSLQAHPDNERTIVYCSGLGVPFEIVESVDEILNKLK